MKYVAYIFIILLCLGCSTVVIEPRIPLITPNSVPHYYVPQFKGTVQTRKMCRITNTTEKNIRVHWISLHPYRLVSPLTQDLAHQVQEQLLAQGIKGDSFPFWILSGNPQRKLFMSMTSVDEVRRYGLKKLPMMWYFDKAHFPPQNICDEDPSYVALQHCLSQHQDFLVLCSKCHYTTSHGLRLDGGVALSPKQAQSVPCDVPLGPDDMHASQLVQQQQASQPGMDTALLWIVEDLAKQSRYIVLDTWRQMSKRHWHWSFDGLEEATQ